MLREVNLIAAAIVLLLGGVASLLTYWIPHRSIVTRTLDRLWQGVPMAIPYRLWLLFTGFVCIGGGLAFLWQALT